MTARRVLAGADLFISYLTGDSLESRFAKAVDSAEIGEIELLVCSEIYDDVVTALRSQGVNLEEVETFISDMRAIPHLAIPVDTETAREALRVYIEHRGPRRLHYFDSYHVATPAQHDLPLLTSDKYIIRHAPELGIEAMDARSL